LGLVISKNITEQYEGNITLESELGVGSIFTMKFKIFESDEPEQLKRI
jgi:signal transduction histidine kinase